MRRVMVVFVVLGGLAVAGWFGYQRYAASRVPQAPPWDEVAVVSGDIAATVSATGTVLPEREADLSLQATGIVSDVAVEIGDRVEAGQLLARLDTADLELALRQAEINLRSAEAQVRQLQEKPKDSDVAAARAALVSAQTAYQQLLRGSDADQFAAARASVEQARVALEQAQQAYDKVKDMPNVGLLPQSLQLQQATINYETAQAQYRVTARAADDAQIAAAQAQIAQAQANLDRLFAGPTAEQVEIAQAAVDQARVALEQSQRRLDDAFLRAPWDSIVTQVNVTEGVPPPAALPAVQLADISRFHIDVQVDEIDIAGIAEGQPVGIDVDALPDDLLTGRVQRISPTALTTPTGGKSYLVRIDIDPTEAPLRAGMSATANIVSNSREGVLLIPNRAVQRERETGAVFVERLQAGEPQRVEVRLGLRDDLTSEVREGLAEGDRVIIRNVSSLERLQQSFGGGF